MAILIGGDFSLCRYFVLSHTTELVNEVDPVEEKEEATSTINKGKNKNSEKVNLEPPLNFFKYTKQALSSQTIAYRGKTARYIEYCVFLI